MLTSTTRKTFQGIPLSVLDLAPVTEGSDPSQSFINSVDLARHVEQWGFNRYWLAEHHSMPGIASSATSVLIGHIAGNTNTIRVGSGGIMLPNHSALVIAEQFGTLESLYPNRIDLGIGRAPGTDEFTAYALRRNINNQEENFPTQLEELRDYFTYRPAARVRAIPGEGLQIPIWLLGSSDYSATFSSQLGLPFSFASHFAPDFMMQALDIYRSNFKPSDVLDKPYVMIGINIICADTTERAEWLASSLFQQFLNLRRGNATKLPKPVKNMDEIWSPIEKSFVERSVSPHTTFVGDEKTVKQKLEHFINMTKADELMINSQIYYHEDRLRSFEILGHMME